MLVYLVLASVFDEQDAKFKITFERTSFVRSVSLAEEIEVHPKHTRDVSWFWSAVVFVDWCLHHLHLLPHSTISLPESG